MSEPNKFQQRIIDTTEGMIVVDAGPGTGKTSTIVERYCKLLEKKDLDPRDITLLTFTRNAATEMEERIRRELSKNKKMEKSKYLQAGTFDSLCLNIVMESPERISEFFGIEEKLTRRARLVENETLNRIYFSQFLDRFMVDRGDDYGLDTAIASTYSGDVYRIISKLLSKGILPRKDGWFGNGWEREILGDAETLRTLIENINSKSKAKELINHSEKDLSYEFEDIVEDYPIPEAAIDTAVNDDRSSMIRMIHDLYHAFIKRSIIDNRLSFALNAAFAFVSLYNDKRTRERYSCEYLMIDEFQDTNANQMMIALMLLKKGNLCVVGDWKQGIYGFRFVSIDNIIDFDQRVNDLSEFLNYDGDRVPYRIGKVEHLQLEVNYRSSQKVIDTSFDCLYLKGTDNDKVDKEKLDKDIVRITADRKEIGDDTAVEFVKVNSKEEEADETVNRILRYVGGGFFIHRDKERAKAEYSDIAVLCRNTAMCRMVYERAVAAGIPAYLQGDVEIMSTREGKLVLAWLRYINNRHDKWGIGAILADYRYSLNSIRSILREHSADGTDDNEMEREIIEDLESKRSMLSTKRRRITDLVSSIFAMYGLNNDITQSIISVLSDAHRNSLMTISDLIMMIETDIKDGTKYNVDGMLDRPAVIIQTIHKSKGLEYPIVIIPGLDSRSFPNTSSDKDIYTINPITGIRCKKRVYGYGGDELKIVNSWRTYLVKQAIKKDYDEERRVLFVAVSRAKQYVTMIAGNNASSFFNELRKNEPVQGLSDREAVSVAENICPQLTLRPFIPEFKPRRRMIGVHDILDFQNMDVGDACDEVCFKGMEYGSMVHDCAETMAKGGRCPDFNEKQAVLDVLSSEKDSAVMTEIDCSLPVEGMNVTLKGIIDLLAVREDCVVVHDYKTDETDRFESEYMLQLSIYAHAASGVYKKKVLCEIDYVSMGPNGQKKVFDPLPMELIEERVKRILTAQL